MTKLVTICLALLLLLASLGIAEARGIYVGYGRGGYYGRGYYPRSYYGYRPYYRPYYRGYAPIYYNPYYYSNYYPYYPGYYPGGFYYNSPGFAIRIGP